MRRGAALAALAAALACSDTPTLPGEFLGSFLFSGNLIVDGGAGDNTTCVLDGGVLFFPPTVQFYAQLSELEDAGSTDGSRPGFWQLANGPLSDGGTATASTYSITTQTAALLSGCNCSGLLTETVTLSAQGALQPGVALLSGTLDDRLSVDPTATGKCSADAGPGCGLGCDLVYEISGVPGRP